jgi:hypothetical protein
MQQNIGCKATATRLESALAALLARCLLLQLPLPTLLLRL